MPHFIANECIGCGSCMAECPTNAITEGTPYVIDPDLCIDCGACASVCPVSCISQK